MLGRLARWSALFLAMILCSCSGNEKPPSEPSPTDADNNQSTEANTNRGQGPSFVSGYSDEPIRVQVAPDLYEQHSPDPRFLFVRIDIDGPQTLVPGDYQLEAGGEKRSPHAIGFGHPNGIYASVETFVGESVKLVPAGADQLFHDGRRVQKCELKNPMVFLVFDVPSSEPPLLRQGEESSPLNPDFEKLAADLSGTGGNLTVKSGLNLTDPNATSDDYTAELLSTQRTRLELDTMTWDVVVVTMALSAPEPTTIEVKKSDLKLAGSGQSRVYFHFTGDAGRLTAGSSYIEGETYEGQELIGLDSGSFRVSLSPGSPVNATMIFRDPEVSGSLDLKLSAKKSLRIPEPVNPLGKFPPPVEKLPGMVAWAPMVGPPIDAGGFSQPPSLAPDAKRLDSPSPAAPGEGLRHLVVSFRVEEDTQFVPIDYRVAEKESGTVYRPVAVAFGDSPVFVKGLDYEKIPLKRGDSTGPEHQGGRLTAWTIKTPQVKLLYEVAPAPQYIFLHGETQFVIEN